MTKQWSNFCLKEIKRKLLLLLRIKKWGKKVFNVWGHAEHSEKKTLSCKSCTKRRKKNCGKEKKSAAIVVWFLIHLRWKEEGKMFRLLVCGSSFLLFRHSTLVIWFFVYWYLKKRKKGSRGKEKLSSLA